MWKVTWRSENCFQEFETLLLLWELEGDCLGEG